MDAPEHGSIDVLWSSLAKRIVDLSLDVYDHAPSYPGDPVPEFRPHTLVADAGYGVTQLVMGTHQGTHADAPSHYLEGCPTVEQLDVRRLMGPALLIDLSRKVAQEAIEAEDLAPWAEHVTRGARVILSSGWDRQLGDPGYFTAYPSMTVDCARWLVARGVALVGMDMPSPSHHDCAEVHRILLAAGVVVVEALAHLDQIKATHFTLLVSPLRLRGCDGSPARAFALLPG